MKRLKSICLFAIITSLFATGCASKEVSIMNEESTYKNGTYIGEGKGKDSTIKVEVTLEDDKITDIKMVSQNDTAGYADKAFENIKKEILENEDYNVDNVSGATKTTKGITDAIQNALENSQK
ncbi:FMN-binding protein [Tepidibacter hydrothermalis]|uniref:FMN-binding protein n=1 Tax=Tepidibacter hydrothermalis TaxID=3036126 RepID=A0ABY8EFP6_9FIRM|nr:FMN-binding protein [Tepidibacter hydrothermalis]WFD10675.1 FMN-binding protein [Tepidibacter hydrothermalis]